MNTATALAIEHLQLRLRPLNRALRHAVEQQGRIAARLIRPDVAPLCVTDNQVNILLDNADALLCDKSRVTEPALFTPEEAVSEEKLRRRAAATGVTLPFDRLSQGLNLTVREQEAVLLCAALELDRSYERIYAYILDDLNRRWPCVELLCSLTATSLGEQLVRRHALSRFGMLRRKGVLLASGNAATEMRQELRLAPGLFEFLTGAAGDLISHLRDPAEIDLADSNGLPSNIDRETASRLGQAIASNHVDVLCIRGPRHTGKQEAAMVIAAAAGKPLRRLLLATASQEHIEQERKIIEAIQTAAALNAILLVSTDGLSEPGNEFADGTLAQHLAASSVPSILIGVHAWRPMELLAARRYAEIELEAPPYAARRTIWKQALPEVNEERLDDLAAQFRLSDAEVHAIARVARTEAKVASNGHLADVSDQLEKACATVSRRQSHRFATEVKPKRGPDDLILPKDLHRQVIEVARFFRVWPRVADEWGFGRLVTGEGGIKALFTGDSGTGKTLAAEVIAGVLGMPLLKVDLARIVSKWVGETEKHLEATFNEAEQSHAILFFDEADALFGKRGEVRHGTDRYANLEVSYLLQRIEAYYGLVILASNLRENIDAAFTRRFQIVIHFPRPELADRRRIWDIAFPKAASLDGGIDLNSLARLDMTGASIVSAARTAALMAAEEESEAITMLHVVRAIARQYRREARVLSAGDLGPHAALLQEVR